MKKEKILEKNHFNAKHKVLYCTILVLNVIFFMSFPETNSKYIKEVDFTNTTVLYDNDFVRMLPESGVNASKRIVSNSIEKVVFSFSFNRNNIMMDGETETYTITVPDACSITSIEDKTSSNISLQNGKISYSEVGESTVNVRVECNVSELDKKDNDSKADISYEVTEKVYGDFASIDYYKSYITVDIIKSTNNLRVSGSNIYEELVQMLQLEYFPGYVEGVYSDPVFINNMEDAILEYVKVLKDVKTIDQLKPFLDENNHVKGLSGVTVELGSNYVVFEIQDTFNGYAETYTNNNMILHFSYDEDSASKIETVERVFNEYIEYFFPNQTDRDTIANYLSKYNVGDYIVNGGNSIPGLDRRKQDSNYNVIDITNLLSQASVTDGLPIKIGITKGDGTTATDLRQLLMAKINSCIDSGACKGVMKSTVTPIIRPLISLLSKFVADPTTALGDNRFIIPEVIDGNTRFLLINLYSTGVEEDDGKIYICFDLEILSNSDYGDYTISYTKNSTNSANTDITITLINDSPDIRDSIFHLLSAIYEISGQHVPEDLKEQLKNLTTETPLTLELPNVVAAT